MMPLIRSFQILIDRLLITRSSGVVKTFLYSSIPNGMTAAEIEAFGNTYLENPANGINQDAGGRIMYSEFHVRSATPLVFSYAASADPLPTDWWRTWRD